MNAKETINGFFARLNVKGLAGKINGLIARLPFRGLAERIPAGARAKVPLLNRAIPWANQIACGLGALVVVTVIACSGGGKDGAPDMAKRYAQLERKAEAGTLSGEEQTEYERLADLAASGAFTLSGPEPVKTGSKLEIAAEKDGEAVTSVDAYAYADNAGLAAVVIAEGITSIGDFAFANCAKLKSVTLPASLEYIGDGAFLNCPALTEVSFAANSASGQIGYKRLGNFAFMGCTGLDAAARAALAELGVRDFENQNIAVAVPGGLSFTKAPRYNPDLPVAEAGMVIRSGMIGRNLFSTWARRGNTRLVSAKIAGGTFTGVLERLDGDAAEMRLNVVMQSGTDNRNYVAYMKAENLTSGQTMEGSWIIPGYDLSSGSNAEASGDAIGRAIGAVLVPITDLRFYINERLGERANPGVVSEAFFRAWANTFVPDSEFTVALTSDNQGVVIKKYTGSQWVVNIPKTIQDMPVREIDKGAFERNTRAFSFSIPEGVTKIGEEAFYNIWATSVTLPEGLVSIGRSAFAYSGVTKIQLPDSVTEIGRYAFRESNLESITLPRGMKKIPDRIFYECKRLSSVDIPEGVTEIGYSAFSGCTALAAVTLPQSLVTIGRYAFSQSGLTAVVLPDGVTKMGDSAFDSCKALVSVRIPDKLTNFRYGNFGKGAFANCSNLTTVDIAPIKRTWMGGSERLDYRAFYQCPKLDLKSQAALKAAGYTGDFN